MKQLLFILLGLSTSIATSAQNSESAPAELPTQIQASLTKSSTVGFDDTTQNVRSTSRLKQLSISFLHPPKGKEQTKRVMWRNGRWAGVGIHYTGLVTNLGNFSLPDNARYLSQSSKSIGITLNPIDFILVGNRNFHLMTGLGFELNNIRFDQDIALKYEHGVLSPDLQYIEQGIHLKKSKLFTAYVNIPLLIEFQGGHNHNFFVNAGIIGGLRIGAHSKIQAAGPTVGGTSKEHSDFGLRNCHYGYTLNFGYSHVGFNITYYRSPLWRKDAGPQVQQINAGISLVF